MENTELLQSIINEAGIQTTHDAAVIAIHYALLSQGFILLGENDSIWASTTLPPNWNKKQTNTSSLNSNSESASTTDVYDLKYSFGVLRTCKFQIKALVAGNQLIVHVLSLADNASYSEEIDLEYEIGKSVPSSATELASKIQKLAVKLSYNFIQPIRALHTPASNADIGKPPKTKLITTSPSSSTSPDTNSRLYVPSKTLISSAPTNPFSIGEGDKSPFGVQPSTGGGMYMDPSHPLFGSRFSPSNSGYQPRGGGPLAPGFLPPGAVVPHARFDPIYPVGPGNPPPIHPSGFNPPPPGRRGPRSDPDPDHLPPPGYGDMFM